MSDPCAADPPRPHQARRWSGPFAPCWPGRQALAQARRARSAAGRPVRSEARPAHPRRTGRRSVRSSRCRSLRCARCVRRGRHHLHAAPPSARTTMRTTTPAHRRAGRRRHPLQERMCGAGDGRPRRHAARQPCARLRADAAVEPVRSFLPCPCVASPRVALRFRVALRPLSGLAPCAALRPCTAQSPCVVQSPRVPRVLVRPCNSPHAARESAPPHVLPHIQYRRWQRGFWRPRV